MLYHTNANKSYAQFFLKKQVSTNQYELKVESFLSVINFLYFPSLGGHFSAPK